MSPLPDRFFIKLFFFLLGVIIIINNIIIIIIKKSLAPKGKGESGLLYKKPVVDRTHGCKALL